MAAFKEETLKELLKGYEKPEDLLGDGGILKELKKALIEKALGAELSEHLGYEKGEQRPAESDNSRNGYSGKTIQDEDGPMELEIPRDRNGSFEPRLIRKGQRRIPGLDDKILSLYARGMTVREIQSHLQELYGTEISPSLISRVTDAVIEEIQLWQSRPLAAVYPIVIFDALRVRIRDEGVVRNKAVYLALALDLEGEKEVLGLWIEQTEGAKFWLRVMTELRNRGVQDILIAVVDGLKGFPEAITAIFPQTEIQTCIVHLVRHSLGLAAYRDYKALAVDLRKIYRAATETEAKAALEDFADTWGSKYPNIVQAWRRNWERVVPFLAYPPELRRVVYTTNAIESLHMTLRKIIKNRGSFPSDESATKLLYLALRNVARRWKRPAWKWRHALNHFSIRFGDRVPISSI
jgi:putative transposase